MLGVFGDNTFLQRGSPPPPPWRLSPDIFLTTQVGNPHVEQKSFFSIQKEMKATGSMVLCATLVLAGCSGPAATSTKVPAAIVEPVPLGYYRIEGIVQQPGLIQCKEENETLMTIISRAGGFSNIDHTPRRISVVYSNKTQIFSMEKILAGKTSDPAVPGGATIQATRRME